VEAQFSRRDVLSMGTISVLAGLAGTARAGEYAVRRMIAHPKIGFADAFEDGKYKLPPLPYSYSALEPFYHEQILRIHHTKHHAGYVKGLNSTLEKLKTARDMGDYGSIKALSRDLAFYGSGHVLHCLFWHSIKPGGSTMPPALAETMAHSFGSVDNAQRQFAAAAKVVEASGWAVLAYEPVGEKLLILQAEKHQNLAFWTVTPLLVCDVWEHAYYLQYENDRGAWVDNFMKLANWQFAFERLAEAKQITLTMM